MNNDTSINTVTIPLPACAHCGVAPYATAEVGYDVGSDCPLEWNDDYSVLLYPRSNKNMLFLHGKYKPRTLEAAVAMAEENAALVSVRTDSGGVDFMLLRTVRRDTPEDEDEDYEAESLAEMWRGMNPADYYGVVERADGAEPDPAEVVGILKTFSQWARGEVYYARFALPVEVVFDSCYGFYSEEEAVQFLKENIPADQLGGPELLKAIEDEGWGQ